MNQSFIRSSFYQEINKIGLELHIKYRIYCTHVNRVEFVLISF
jgi:hypothetical protein